MNDFVLRADDKNLYLTGHAYLESLVGRFMKVDSVDGSKIL